MMNPAEKQLRSETLKWILYNLNAVFWSLDVQSFSLLNISQSCVGVYGYPPERFYHDQTVLKKLVTPEICRYLREKTRKKDSGPLIFEDYIENADGQEIWVKNRIFPTYSAGGKLIRLDGILSEITDMKKLEESLRESRNKIKELHKVALDMQAIEDEDKIYQLTVKAAEEILKFDFCDLDIVVGDKFKVKATSTGVIPEGVSEMTIYEGIAGKTFREGRSFHFADIRGESEAKPAQNSYRSALSIPVGKFGVFQVVSHQVQAFNKEDLELAEMLISHTTAAIQRIRSEKDIRFLSFHDSLTKLYNRSFFEEELKRVDTERQLPLSLIWVDLNGLKLVNDAFGHKEGDRLLQRAAEILQASCRQEDIIARVGGDEFVLLLPGTDPGTASDILQRINNACAAVDNMVINLSLSFGTATKTEVGEDINDVLKRAEERMYSKKLKESEAVRMNILSSLRESLWKKGEMSRDDYQKIEEIALLLGEKMCFSGEKLAELSTLVHFHDIGKLVTSDGDMHKHPEFGCRIARSSYQIAAVAEMILSHHENWDGSGYPQGLIGEEIPLLSRIISLAQAYVRLREKENYSPEEALQAINRAAGEKYDPELVRILNGIIN